MCNETSLPSLRTAVLKRGSSINTSANPEAMSTPPQAQEEYEDVSDGDEMVTDIDTVTSDKNDSVASAAPHGGRSDEVARLTIEVGMASLSAVLYRIDSRIVSIVITCLQ